MKSMNKSIVSHNRPVFEFAKRTCIGESVVSGISFNQLLSNSTVGNRVANVLSFGKSGHLKSVGMVLSLLTRGALTQVSGLKDRLTRVSLLALLGSLHKMCRVSLMELVTALIPPDGGFEGQTISLPYAAVLKLAHGRLVSDEPVGNTDSVPWPNSDIRREVFEEHKSFFTIQVLTSAASAAESLLRSWRKSIVLTSYNFIFPLVPQNAERHEVANIDSYFLDLPGPYQELLYQLPEWVGEAVGLASDSEDPAELVEETADALEQFQYDEELSLEEALKLESRVEDTLDRVVIEQVKEPEHIIQSTPIIGMMRSLLGLNRLKMSKAAFAGSFPNASP